MELYFLIAAAYTLALGAIVQHYTHKVRVLKNEILERETGHAEIVDSYEQDFLSYEERIEAQLAHITRQDAQIAELEAENGDLRQGAFG